MSDDLKQSIKQACDAGDFAAAGILIRQLPDVRCVTCGTILDWYQQVINKKHCISCDHK